MPYMNQATLAPDLPKPEMSVLSPVDQAVLHGGYPEVVTPDLPTPVRTATVYGRAAPGEGYAPVRTETARHLGPVAMERAGVAVLGAESYANPAQQGAIAAQIAHAQRMEMSYRPNIAGTTEDEEEGDDTRSVTAKRSSYELVA